VSVQLKPSQLDALVFEMIKAQLPFIVTGKPGIGKTSIIKQAAKRAGFRVIVSTPAIDDPTDGKGIPWGDKNGNVAFRPIGLVAEVLASTVPTLWFLDDFGQAGTATQAAYMPWLLGRECAGHRLPDCVSICAGTNARTHKAGVGGLLEPVKSRFATIVELVEDVDEWCAWAVQQTWMPPLVVAYMRFSRDSLCRFEPSADLVNCPLPRTWENAGRVFNLDLPRAVQAASVAGAVGEGEATKFLGFADMFRQLPSIDGILLNPDTAPIPADLGALYAVVTGLAAVTNENNLGRVVVYLQRLADENRGDFAALAVQDAARRNQSIQQTPDFVRMMSGPIGQLVSGVVN
jgi:hypothetical protein